MRTTKRFVILILAIIMSAIVLVPSTFSWYDHDGSLSGEKMEYKREGLPVSNGTLTMETHKLKMKKESASDAYETIIDYDEKGQMQPLSGTVSNDTVNNGRVQYYLTTFTNSSTAPAMANLYLLGFRNLADIYLGTTSPNLTEKNLAAQASKPFADNGIVRVYLEHRNQTDWVAGSSVTLYAVANNDTDNKIAMYKTATNDSTHKVYYADLPAGTTEFYFCTSKGSDYTGWHRTSTITDISTSLYYLTGQTVEDSTGNAEAEKLEKSGLAGISKYYKEIQIAEGRTTDISLPSQYYSGESIEYAIVGNASAASIDSNTNILTKLTAAGTTIRTTVTGVFGDEFDLDTVIKTDSSLDSVPVVMNLKVNGKEDGKNGTEKVVWYIRNDRDTADNHNLPTFTGIVYTK